MKNYLFVIILSVIGVVLTRIQVQALDFSFSITDDFGRGTITGEILGLQNNATSDPSDILFTSLPADFNLTTPYSLRSNGWLFVEGGFTVTNGAITSDNYVSSTPPTQNTSQYSYIELNSATTNTVYVPQEFIANQGGLAGQDLAVESPESPTIWLTIAAGFILVVYLKYFFHKKTL